MPSSLLEAPGVYPRPRGGACQVRFLVDPDLSWSIPAHAGEPLARLHPLSDLRMWSIPAHAGEPILSQEG